jgi:hypothetical protein
LYRIFHDPIYEIVAVPELDLAKIVETAETSRYIVSPALKTYPVDVDTPNELPI